MWLVLTLTEHNKHRKNEKKVELEEDLASKSANVIGEGYMRGVRKLDAILPRFCSERVMRIFLSHGRVGLRGSHGH